MRCYACHTGTRTTLAALRAAGADIRPTCEPWIDVAYRTGRNVRERVAKQQRGEK